MAVKTLSETLETIYAQPIFAEFRRTADGTDPDGKFMQVEEKVVVVYDAENRDFDVKTLVETPWTKEDNYMESFAVLADAIDYARNLSNSVVVDDYADYFAN